MIMRMIVVPILMVSVSVAGATTTPLVTLQGTNNKVSALLKVAAAPGTPADQDRKAKIKAMAAGLFDYKELVKRAMADHWTTITPAQQDELVSTLKELIERKYVQQLKSNVDYKVKYGAEKVTGGDASVMTTLKVNTKGKSTDAEVEYKMHDKDGVWLVWDVITDETSLMRNYKGQFDRIIRNEGGYKELIKRMKDKLKEPEEK
jgi:phospholipid transport system substrate-binding protein